MARLLVVDDEAGVLFTLVANLELEGFEVVGSSSGFEALDELDRGRFDLVLTDVRMPGMSGVELYRKIRELEIDVPVVLMTGFAHEVQIETVMREGAFAVLPKPLPVDRLIELLGRALERPLVLVVDDALAVGESTVSALAEVGIRAETVADGESAVKRLAAGPVDVCIVDLVMDHLDGAETIERILAADPRVICIAITGENVPALVRRAAANAYTVLKKPVAPLDLAATIARARSQTVQRPAR